MRGSKALDSQPWIRLASSVRHGLTNLIASMGIDPQDSEEVRLQKTILVGGSFMVVTAGAVWGAMYIYFGEPLAGSISLSYSAVTLISLLILRVSRRHHFFMVSQLLLGLVLPFLQMLALGGFMNSGGVFLWSLISPLGGLLLYESKRALPLWLAYLALLVLGGMLQPTLRASNNLPAGMVNILFILNTAAVSAIAISTISYFIDRKNDTLRMLRIEEEKSENLLLNILPREIAAILKNENRTIADQFEGASVLFADVVGFTPLTARMAPVEMVNLLNEIFSAFDALVEKYDLEKIRTIGDNYMVASGVPRTRPDHADAIAALALEMNAYITRRNQGQDAPLQFRFGINSGPVVGGVIGRKKFVYDLWGDAVNIASRMESHGLPGRIQITQSTYELIKDRFVCEPRGPIRVKGKGDMQTWFLLGPVYS